MIHILCLETATTNCSVSISSNGNVAALVESNDKEYSHSENLHSFIKEALTSASLSFSDLHAVAVSKGPGSYTGLRIGVSAAKGLCFSLGIPLISLPTLEVLAHQASIKEGFIIPMLDARRNEVYTAVFNAEKKLIKDTWAEVLEEDSFEKYLAKEQVYFIGNSNGKASKILSHTNTNFAEDAQFPSAKEMAQLAFSKYQIRGFEDVAYFEPYYLKDFVAIKPKR
jgi:tRNA threonylcarbamoyladenosine biosynthesis protein TsaB